MVIPSVQSFRFDPGDTVTPAGDHLSRFPFRQLENVDRHLWPTGSKCVEPYGMGFCVHIRHPIRLPRFILLIKSPVSGVTEPHDT